MLGDNFNLKEDYFSLYKGLYNFVLKNRIKKWLRSQLTEYDLSRLKKSFSETLHKRWIKNNDIEEFDLNSIDYKDVIYAEKEKVKDDVNDII